MTYKNVLRAALIGVAVTVFAAGSAFAADCGCGKCGSGCGCGGSGGCSLPKIAK